MLITEQVLAIVGLVLGFIAVGMLVAKQPRAAAWYGAVGFVLCQVIWVMRLNA
jgi:hypothetical protein